MLIVFLLPVACLRGPASSSPALDRLCGSDIRTPGGGNMEGMGTVESMDIGMGTLPGGMAVHGPMVLLPLAWWMQADRIAQVFAAVAALLVLFTRRGNVQRLSMGTEPRHA